MSISGFFQFIIGFTIGVLLLAGSGAAAAYFFLSSLSENPPKPVFSEEQPPEATPTTEEATEETQAQGEESTAEDATSNAEPAPTETLEEGAYRARVTWPQGLSLRAEPNQSAERIGGLAYQQEIVVLGTNDDQEWEKVRVSSNGREGWVKSGNTEKLSD